MLSCGKASAGSAAGRAGQVPLVGPGVAVSGERHRGLGVPLPPRGQERTDSVIAFAKHQVADAGGLADALTPAFLFTSRRYSHYHRSQHDNAFGSHCVDHGNEVECEGPATGEQDCYDGKDGDGDGKVDCDDADCGGDPNCP